MIKIINQRVLRREMRKIINYGLALGKTTKTQPLYPTPSGLNIKVHKNPFLDTTDDVWAMYRVHKEVKCGGVPNHIPDGYTKSGGLGFCNKEIKDRDIMFSIQKAPKRDPKTLSVDKDEQMQYLKSRVKIGDVITPPHFYIKDPQLQPHYYIDELWSKGKNTGTNAIKSIVLDSLNDPQTQGRVLLEASRIDGKTHPVGFYYKLGFRSTSPRINERCAKWLAEGGKLENAPWGGGW